MWPSLEYIGVTRPNKGKPIGPEPVETAKIVDRVDDTDHMGAFQLLLGSTPVLLNTGCVDEDCIDAVWRDFGWNADFG